MFGNLFGGFGNMLSNIGQHDPWAGIRQVGGQAPMNTQQRAHSVFGNMAGMQQPDAQAQFSPVQLAGPNPNGNQLSQLVMSLMQRGQ